MKFSEYELELRLAFSQHPKDSREEEIYSLILSLMRDVYSEKIYKEKIFSIRDIHKPTRVRRKILYRESGYPDLAVYSQKLEDDTKEEWSDYILGAVEAKAIGETCREDQILNEIRSFHKLIYTNGILWVYYDDCEKKVNSLDDDVWRINLLKEEENNKCAKFNKKSENIDVIPELSSDKWDKLKELLKSIDWKK